MKYFDLRKPNNSHLYYIYVYPEEGKEGEPGKPALLYRTASVKQIKKLMGSQHRKIDIAKVW